MAANTQTHTSLHATCNVTSEFTMHAASIEPNSFNLPLSSTYLFFNLPPSPEKSCRGDADLLTPAHHPSLAAPLPPPPLPSIGGFGGGIVNDVDGGGSGSAGDAVIEEESDPREAFQAFAESGGWTVGLSSNNDKR